MTGNRGNAYLSLYKVAGIDGLLIENNDIRAPGEASGISTIFVMSSRASSKTKTPFPCHHVTIRNNTVNGSILIEGEPASNNLVEGNRFVGRGTGTIINQANAVVRNNQGFEDKAQ
jgi:hypothetical protein